MSIHKIKVITNARKNEISGQMADGTIKIRIKSKPVRGKANKELIRFLSELLDIPKGDVLIVSGERSRRKRVRIANISKQEFQELINL